MNHGSLFGGWISDDTDLLTPAALWLSLSLWGSVTARNPEFFARAHTATSSGPATESIPTII